MVQRTEYRQEINDTEEKHLLIARNVIDALSRYVKDVEAAFQFMAVNAEHGREIDALPTLLDSLHFRHFCIVDHLGNVEVSVSAPGNPEFSQVPAAIMSALSHYIRPAAAGRARPDFSAVIRDWDGHPTIFIVQSLAGNRVALGALRTDYLVHMQSKLTFGKGGHAAIVDRMGQVIAHPKTEWRESIKDISSVAPVARMMAGESGVMTFFAPAKNADMIAGYATVPRTGWGVMVPQPLTELEEKSQANRVMQIATILFGLVAAAVFSWWLARYLTAPIQTVIGAAKKYQTSRMLEPIPAQNGVVPRVFRDLTSSFNSLATEVNGDRRDLTRNIDSKTSELVTEVTVRQHSEEQFNRLAEAIESMPELFALYDADERLVNCNKRFRDEYAAIAGIVVPGVRFDEIIRAAVAKDIYPEAIGREAEWSRERVEKHRNPSGPFELPLREGRWLLVHGQKLPDGGTAVVSTDISRQKQLESLKDDFISIVSHEMRTPLTSIKGSLSLLGGEIAGRLPRRPRGYLRSVIGTRIG